LEPSRESRSSHDPVEFYPQESPADIQLHNHAVVVLAQKGIGRVVCEREIRIRQLTSELKSARRVRDKSVESDILTQINVLKHQQLLLRRLADAILAHLVIKNPGYSEGCKRPTRFRESILLC
jgi:hypothetical protein